MEETPLTPEAEQLLHALNELKTQLRTHTLRQYRRVNPFTEDLCDNWKYKGELFGGTDVTIYDSTTVVGDVQIGDHSWIGPFCSLDGTGGLKIGAYCSISAGSHLLTHDTVRWALTGGKHSYEHAATEIGDCCFVGTHAIVTKGVSIGSHCVVGAGAVVTKDIPDHSIVMGVPAAVVGKVRVNGSEVCLDYGISLSGAVVQE